ncbi:lycopene cyclase domain-containing protein, partial [Frankia sp. AiPa1]
MSYTALAVVGVVAAVVADLWVLRTRLVRRRIFWVSYAIVICGQLAANGLLTGLRIVRYDPGTILGPRVVFAPVEDLLFGFALITWTLTWWVWWGRRLSRGGGGGGRAGGGGGAGGRGARGGGGGGGFVFKKKK